MSSKRKIIIDIMLKYWSEYMTFYPAFKVDAILLAEKYKKLKKE